MKAAAWTVGVTTLVQAVLVLAKVTGHVDWWWGFVLFPLEALATVALGVLVALLVVMSGLLDCDDGPDEEEDLDA